jgi:hypothetical protein
MLNLLDNLRHGSFFPAAMRSRTYRVAGEVSNNYENELYRFP